VSGEEAIAEAEPGFGHYIYRPKGMSGVSVHQRTYALELTDGPAEGIVHFYYPPRFAFRKAAATVLGGGGRASWICNVSWGEMMAASGFVAVVFDAKPNERELFRALLDRVLAEADALFIDSGRLALWGEGHSTPLQLTAAMSSDLPVEPKAMVCVSPVMQIGETPFEFDPASLRTDLSMLITMGEMEEFYEVRRSVELFSEAAAKAGMSIERLTCPGGSHNWMTTDQYESDFFAAPEAVEVVKKEIEFLRRHL
ncbi:MAG: alpha/beta hydrolase, partial [Spirochaetaceae bacterium]